MHFIVFEGLDGAGKSTLIKGLEAELKAKGQSVVVTREPGGSALGEEIRRLLLEVGPDAPQPKAELLLYQAARAQHVDLVIRPALERGDWVICDRYTSSSLAFQCGGRGIEESGVRWLNQFATDGLEADLTVLLKVSVAVSEQRRSGREFADRFEQEKSEFHQRVHDHYLKQVASAANKWLVLNGENQSPQALAAQLKQDLEARKWL